MVDVVAGVGLGSDWVWDTDAERRREQADYEYDLRRRDRDRMARPMVRPGGVYEVSGWAQADSERQDREVEERKADAARLRDLEEQEARWGVLYEEQVAELARLRRALLLEGGATMATDEPMRSSTLPTGSDENIANADTLLAGSVGDGIVISEPEQPKKRSHTKKVAAAPITPAMPAGYRQVVVTVDDATYDLLEKMAADEYRPVYMQASLVVRNSVRDWQSFQDYDNTPKVQHDHGVPTPTTLPSYAHILEDAQWELRQEQDRAEKLYYRQHEEDVRSQERSSDLRLSVLRAAHDLYPSVAQDPGMQVQFLALTANITEWVASGKSPLVMTEDGKVNVVGED